ncbi:hypothetical protein lerEdw1_000176 [Lerista edwardsae]|nr:hypothetical protein lerEdw1_000176 [Lerista edwardsae]
MEHLSHKALEPQMAETVNEMDTPRTKNRKFLRCKRLSFYGKTMVGSFENNSPNSVMPRAFTLHSLANAKMDAQQPSDTINGKKHPLQRHSGVMHQRMLQETNTTDEAPCRKCLSGAYISKLDDKLLENINFPETQKLQHVVSWAELFLEKHPFGENLQDQSIERSALDQDAEKGIVQNSRSNASTYERTENFDLQLLDADVCKGLSTSETSEHCLECGPPILLNNSTLSSPSKSLCLTQRAKHNWEEKDTVVSTSVSGEFGAVDYRQQSTRKVHFQNSYTVCKDDDLCTPTMDLHENLATYFWRPLNDSSDEEWPDVKTMCLKPPALENKECKNSLKCCDFPKPENINGFSLPLPGDKLSSTKRADSCEKWNPGTEKLLEIKGYEKRKAFMWPLKTDCSSETSDIAENILELAAYGSLSLAHVSDVKKDASRERMSTFQLLKKDTDQRNELKLEHVLGRDEVFEERKFTEEQADGISSGTNCNRDQRGIELKSLMKDPAKQISSFCKNSLPKLSGNSACKADPECFNQSCENAANLCNNYGCILEDVLPRFGNDSMAHTFHTVPKHVQDYRHENEDEHEDVITAVVGPKNNSGELLNRRVKVDGCKKVFWNDKLPSDSGHDDSILAKYYFYLNFLNESKRLQHEDGNHSFSCQELAGFSKDISMFVGGCHTSNNRYEHLDTEYRNRASEESCLKDERTEVVRQLGSHSEEQETNLFANSSNILTDLELANKRQPGNAHVPKDKKMPETRKTSTEVAGPRRPWQRASLAWSFTHGELKPSKSHVQRPASANEGTRKGSYNTERRKRFPSSGCISFKQDKIHCASDITRSNKNKKIASDNRDKRSVLKTTNAWTKSRQQRDSAFQDYREIYLKSSSDSNHSPWLLLPDELWLGIFSLLTHKDISQVSQACRRFYQLARDESFWKEIKLIDCHCLNDDWLTTLGNHHPQCFTLDHCHGEHQRVTDEGLKQFFHHCKGSLKVLNIKGCSGSGLRGDPVLFQASACCSHLASVDVSWTGATDSGLIALVKASKSLQCLSVNGCQITDDAVATLVEKHGKRLKRLEIFGCHSVTAKCMRSVAVKCPNLEVLNIGRVHKVNEDCLAKLVNSMKKLTSLNITGLHTVRDCVVRLIVKKCPNLESLVLKSCSQVTDVSLLEISIYVPSIRYLDIGGCQEVTDVGVQALAGSCHKLSYLDVSSTATSKRGVCLLASFCFRTLECVKLSFCKGITLDAVSKLCKNCRRLKILHLYGCCFMPDLESIKKINKTVQVFHDLPMSTT